MLQVGQHPIMQQQLQQGQQIQPPPPPVSMATDVLIPASSLLPVMPTNPGILQPLPSIIAGIIRIYEIIFFLFPVYAV